MRSLEQYLEEYGQTHRHPVNLAIHKLCVPLILFSTVGLLWCLPLGAWLGLSGSAAFWLNGATVAVLPVLFFYAALGLRAFLAMLLILAFGLLLSAALAASGAPLLGIAAAVWIAAWVAQFIGHRIEGAKPAFLDDLVFLLIGPLFILAQWLPLAPSPAASPRSSG
ncbi:MAG: hypothetical protein KatS3mg125_1584 [Lysobacterales bacterium]|jgi:uncharacterized membrane protein YGL010W|nr:MAG: hypothetical protein KatS3mg125_1584 [Xanthomonadales bacterium]